MTRKVVFSFLYILSISCCCAYVKKFQNGRAKHGFVGNINYDTKTYLPSERWVKQRLDHFKPADDRRWEQRYFINDTFYEKGGPIFLMIGGESTADPIWMVEGQWIKYAKFYKAFCVQLEHRFYGKSHPTKDLSVESLLYLSSEQALADLAYFTEFISVKYKLSDAKWIAFGGSYPGSLAAWFRLKYPHIVTGSISTSAPLEAVIDFKEYLGVVNDALGTTHTSCANNIQFAVAQIENLLQTEFGRNIVKNIFRLCDSIDITNKNDVANLFSTLAGNFEGVVQYNKDNRKFEGAVGTNITVDTLCGIMSRNSSMTLDNFAAVNSLLLDTYQQKCLQFSYKEMIDDLRKVDWMSEAAEGGRQWTYQTCTEFGYYQSSDLKEQPFGHQFPVEFSVQQCADIFGPQFNSSFLEKAVLRTNRNYGGRNLSVTKVVFVNGSIDPWHALGITRSNETGSENVVIYIDGTAHCANMYPDSPDDSDQLKQAREKIQTVIGQWLKAE